MPFLRKHAISLSLFSIGLVFLLHKIPLSDFILPYATEYQANLIEDVVINSFVLFNILFLISKMRIPLGLINMDYSRWPYYLPLLLFVIIFSGGSYGLREMNFSTIDLTLFAAETLSASFLEEFLFRGLIVGLLLLKYFDSPKGVLKVVVYSSLLFGSTHLFNFWSQESPSIQSVLNQVFATTCLGFMMCVIYLKTRNILILVAAHFLSNFLAGLPLVGEVEVLHQSIHSSAFTLKTVIEEIFRLILFGWPLLIGIVMLSKVKGDDIESLVSMDRRS